LAAARRGEDTNVSAHSKIWSFLAYGALIAFALARNGDNADPR
jgi:hypothetical protein